MIEEHRIAVSVTREPTAVEKMDDAFHRSRAELLAGAVEIKFITDAKGRR